MSYQDLKDGEVLEMVGPMGPGFVGAYLFERARWIDVHNPDGALGKDVVGEHVPSLAALADLRERGMLPVDGFVVEVIVEEAPDAPVDESVVEAVVVEPVSKRPKKGS